MNLELLPKWAPALFGLTIILAIVLMAKFWRWVINQAPAVKREQMEREVRTIWSMLAVVGLLISRYMAAYQLGHIPGVWDPVFPGIAADPRNGTEEIITSSVSKAWPIPDAGIGALTYMLEILTGVIGSSRRWRSASAKLSVIRL